MKVQIFLVSSLESLTFIEIAVLLSYCIKVLLPEDLPTSMDGTAALMTFSFCCLLSDLLELSRKTPHHLLRI